MNILLHSTTHGSVDLLEGWPMAAKIKPMPFASTGWVQKDFGSILFQEIKTSQYLMRYFVFRFLEEMHFTVDEQDEGLQSLLSLKGNFKHALSGQKMQTIHEGQFTLLNAG